jgi:hypothetical protein
LPAVLGELFAAGGLYLFLEYKVFRPADRWREKISAAETDPIPVEAGLLSPCRRGRGEIRAGAYGAGTGDRREGG